MKTTLDNCFNCGANTIINGKCAYCLSSRIICEYCINKGYIEYNFYGEITKKPCFKCQSKK